MDKGLTENKTTPLVYQTSTEETHTKDANTSHTNRKFSQLPYYVFRLEAHFVIITGCVLWNPHTSSSGQDNPACWICPSLGRSGPDILLSEPDYTTQTIGVSLREGKLGQK